MALSEPIGRAQEDPYRHSSQYDREKCLRPRRGEFAPVCDTSTTVALDATDTRSVARTNPTVAMSKDNHTHPGFSELPEPNDDFPERRLGRIQPLIEEISEVREFADMLEAVDAGCEKVRFIRFFTERMRKRLWQACDLSQELSPKAIAELEAVDVTADAVRYWCKHDKVKHRRTKSGRYFVDVESALDYAGSR